MIKILHIVTVMNRAGLETMIMNYYRNIDKSKFQFDFIVHRQERGDYDKEIEKLGGKIYRFPILNPFSITYRKKLYEFFKKNKEYRIIHVHQDCLSSIVLKEAKKAGVQVRIAHSHNANQDKNWKYVIKKYYMRQIPRYANRLLACSKDAGDWMFRGNPYLIMNNAINAKNYQYNEKIRDLIRTEFNIEKNLVIGHVGRFNPQKNHFFLIDIFYEISKLNADVKLMLIGTGYQEKKIREKINQFNLNNKVIFIGNSNRVHDLMQAMDVFLFPSLYEGLPLTLIEAQASGLPIFISDTIPKDCIITDNIYVNSLEDDALNWAKKLLGVIKSFKRVDTRNEIRKVGFDIETQCRWLEDYYMEGLYENNDKGYYK